MMDVTVVIATYGSKEWATLAGERAVPSARAVAEKVVWNHGETLHGSRNTGLRRVETEWVCFLDADDELHPGFFTAMEKASADVRAPAVSYVRGRNRSPAKIPRVAGHTHGCNEHCLPFGNWLVIGSVVRADLVRQVGGFRDFAWSEDWDLWVRCYQAGATFEAVPGAVYIAYVRPNSRNRGTYTQAEKLEAHRAIAQANDLPIP